MRSEQNEMNSLIIAVLGLLTPLAASTAHTCPSGYEASGDSCYLYDPCGPTEFHNAAEFCHSRNGILVMGDSTEVKRSLIDWLSRKYLAGSPFWGGMGGSCDDAFECVMDKVTGEVTCNRPKKYAICEARPVRGSCVYTPYNGMVFIPRPSLYDTY